MERDRLKPGNSLAGEFQIDRLIGSGGFARVYRAVQEGLDRPVALKVLRPPDDEGQETPSHRAVERFQREARLMSRLQNPHTVTLYDYGRLDGGDFYMVMEYVDGRTLAKLVAEEGPVGEERLVSIWTQILDSLREAHAVGIIHRDIKPTNVMIYDRVGQPDAVKLLDFGIAKSVARENRNDRDLTTEGAAVGTPKYMSPEQLLGRPLTPASDLFSVGILGHLLFGGDVPYGSTRPAAILDRMKQFDTDIGALEQAREPVRSVARKLLAPDVEDRFQSASEVLGELDGPEPASGQPKVQVGASNSGAAFPMGLDPEGGTDSTEITFASSGATPQSTAPSAETESAGFEPPTPPGSSEFAPPTPPGSSASESRTEAGSDAASKTPASRTPPREQSTEERAEDVGESRGGWRLLAVGTLIVLAGVVGYQFLSTYSDEQESAHDPSSPRAAPEPGRGQEDDRPEGSEEAEATVESAVRAVRSAVAAAESTLENLREMEGFDQPKSDPETTKEPKPSKAAAERSGTTSGRSAGARRRTKRTPPSDQAAADEGASESGSSEESAVKPLDEESTSEGSEDESEKAGDLEVEPWE